MANRTQGDRSIPGPAPNPALLLTDAIKDASGTLEEKIETRLNAMDKAVTILHDDYTRVPTLLDRAVLNIRELVEEKISKLSEVSSERFSGIAQQFVERDKRTDQLTLASSTAIAAALQAQKEAAGETQKSSSLAIAKSEASTAESIRQLQTLFQSSMAGLGAQLADVKSRLDKGEGHTKGIGDGWGILVAGISMLVSLVTVAALLLKH
jgi:hypothetical protein